MNLDQAIKEEIERLERFKAMWLAGMQNEPENYPAEMRAEEWSEQITAFETI